MFLSAKYLKVKSDALNRFESKEMKMLDVSRCSQPMLLEIQIK